MSTPLSDWPTTWLAAATGGLLLAVVAAVLLIAHNDKRLHDAGIDGTSGALEWPFSPRRSRAMVEEYRSRNVVDTVATGVALDSALLVPSYAAFLFVACIWAARGATEPYATAWRALAWGGVVAGGLDLIENAGIVVQLLLGWSFAAPFTALICRIKWLLLLAAVASLPLRVAIGMIAMLR